MYRVVRKMRKKCKACGAPLNNAKCDYCGTVRNVEKRPTTDDLTPQNEELNLPETLEQANQQLEDPQLEDDEAVLLDSMEETETPLVDSQQEAESEDTPLDSSEQNETPPGDSQEEDSDAVVPLDSSEQDETPPGDSLDDDSDAVVPVVPVVPLDSLEQDETPPRDSLEDSDAVVPLDSSEQDETPPGDSLEDDSSAVVPLDSLEQDETPPGDLQEDDSGAVIPLNPLEQDETTPGDLQEDDNVVAPLGSLEQTELPPVDSQIEDSEAALLASLEQAETQHLSDDESQEMLMQPKRTIPIIIAIILIILLFLGIGWFIFNMLVSNVDAFELLEKSFATMEDVDSFSADVELEMQVVTPVTSIDTPINIRMYVEMLDDDNYNMQMDISTDVLGMEDRTTMYWRDGYMYTVQNDVVTREQTNEDSQGDSLAMTEVMSTEFFQDFASSARADRITSGYHLEFIANENAMMDLLLGGNITEIIDGQDDLDMLDMLDMLEMLGMLDDLFEFEEGVLNIYLDSDYMITSASFDMSIDFSLEGFDGSMVIHGDIDIDQVGNVTVDFPPYLDEAEEMVRTPIEESPLLGYWENGEGLVFLWVFGRADSVEFLEDGTAIITENGISDTVSWSPGATGAFTADERPFTYIIDGNTLTITDSSNDVWSFERSGENGDSATIASDDDEDDNGNDEDNDDEDEDDGDENEDEDEDDDDENDDDENDDDDDDDDNDEDNNDEDLATDILGTWEWDNNDDFTYTFFDDGTAVRGFSDSPTDIEWEITDGNVIILHIGTRTEEWEAVIEGNMLTISNLENNNVWNYFRID